MNLRIRSLAMLLLGTAVLGSGGCNPSTSDSHTDWFTMSGLTVQRLSQTSSDPAVFFITLQLHNETADVREAMMTDFIIDARGAGGADDARVDFAVDIGVREQFGQGTCPPHAGADAITESENPIFDVLPGATQEVRARAALPPAADASLTVGCEMATAATGITVGITSEAIVAQSGTIAPTFSGPMTVTLSGTRSLAGGPENNFEASASVSTILDAP